jgi:hypothetical protein
MALASTLVLRTRRRLLVSAALVALGIGVSVAVDESLGAYMTLGALASLLLALHRLGRSGPV